MFIHRYIIKPFIYTFFSGVIAGNLNAQTTIRLSLNEAIQRGKEENKLVGVFKTEESATLSDLDDARMGTLPRIVCNTTYQRFSNVTLYDGVWGKPRSIPKPPDANAWHAGLEASFNIYAGGRQGYVIRDHEHKAELAYINSKEQEGNIGLQVALQYLDLVRIYFQGKLISEQIERAKTRSENINALYVNGKVTKSDLLRADLLLSNALLSETTNVNDNSITNQKLNTLLDLDELIEIIPVDTNLLVLPASHELERLVEDFSGSHAVVKAGKNIEIQENRTKLARSFSLPAATLFAGYAFNYPNTLVLPPVAQTFAVGQVGVRLTYEISSLYQNKYKIRSASLRVTELKQQKEWIEDNVQQEARALLLKYNEAMHRMIVVRKSIEQAEANYKIQNTKYANQLSLLTDLLDADNLYQESRLNYIQANIAAIAIYYRLLFLTGKL
ncbi:TolC family protein [Flavihumibacter solisilvae]|uniref:TolC family protein n=1 Tax=Flavihumibacter solisilvae TaxID=1349421 RepID=UPI00068E0467|nr:TolC family protein [Flavihumibacter solisilvae]